MVTIPSAPRTARACASLGDTNDYLCGYIEEENTGDSGRGTRVGFPGDVGDSGAGAKWNYTIAGIITQIDPNNNDDVIFESAYDTQVNLGNGYFYFNCAVGKKTYSSPTSWGACPTVDP